MSDKSSALRAKSDDARNPQTASPKGRGGGSGARDFMHQTFGTGH
jgi:hypothetical protein